MTLRTRFRRSAVLALGIAGLALATLPASAQDGGSYSYIRTLDGPATVILAGSETRERAEINQPILPGDRLLVSNGSRVELVLSDRSLVHVAGATELAFDALALSPDDSSDLSYDDRSDRSDDYADRDVRASVLRLLDGEVRIETDNFPRGIEPPQVETGNATVYLGEHGSFRLISEQDDWSEVTVREGSAEIATERGSQIVRDEQTAVIEGVGRARISLRTAVGRDALERWAEVLLDQGDSYGDRYVDDDLRYSSVPLSTYGSWITVDRRQVWRPRVSAGWRPYSQGRWRNGPGGAIWISSEPWGWVPYHYGTWDYFPGYGWGWVPGRVFSPAWVYWYWGPSYVGWCPVGYYTRYYGGSGFRDGLYGWAHGSGSFFAEWNFVPFGNFGDRDLGRRVRRGRDLGRALERGIVTTDTRPLGRERWSDPTRAIEILRRGRPDLPDVSDFVARKRDLPPAVQREIAIGRERPNDRLNGTPLRPGTLGGGSNGAAPGAPTANLPRGRTRWNTDGGAVEGQPAPRAGRDSGRSGLDTRETGRETPGRESGRSGLDTRETGRETNGRDSGRSGLDTPRETGRERTSPGERTGGDTPVNSEPGVERRRPVDPESRPSARPVTPDPGPYSGQPAPDERRHPIYQRPDREDSGDSGSKGREAEPVRERPVVRERPSYDPPARPAEPPPSASRRDEPSASRRDEPSSPPQREEARPRQQPKPDSASEPAAPRHRRSEDRPAPSNDEGEAGAPPPR
ncbi:MAG TPA: DUF6600 domain-containing protein [Thermoanaerobaculia bacterium]|nr:DUF6600 domain-containing protein [Thermoanaerobaculia bacterium]